MNQPWFWVIFNVVILLLLALDLGLLRRRQAAVPLRAALGWSALWIALALAFNAYIYFWLGREAALQYLTGYLIEKSLSVDNIFVFAVVFSYFNVPAAYQHKVLFYGILGALVMRAVMIFAGIALLEAFHWLIYVFGAVLVLSGIKLAVQHGKQLEPEKNPALRLLRRVMPVTPDFHGERFFTRIGLKRYATPLFVVLLLIEATDLVFAVDSIPAILAITRDPVIVYSSNVFAILGLRSLYFALAGVMGRFTYLHYGLAAVLVFIGAKMCLIDVYKVPVGMSLGVVSLLIGASMLLSLRATRAHSPQVSSL